MLFHSRASSRRIDRVVLGAVDQLDNGTRGTYYFDAFESRRNTYIGPVSGFMLVQPTPTDTPCNHTDHNIH